MNGRRPVASTAFFRPLRHLTALTRLVEVLPRANCFFAGAMNTAKHCYAAGRAQLRRARSTCRAGGVSRYQRDQIVSRLGVTRTADILLSPGQDLRAALCERDTDRQELFALIDEAQFQPPSRSIRHWPSPARRIPVVAFGIHRFQDAGFSGQPAVADATRCRNENDALWQQSDFQCALG